VSNNKPETPGGSDDVCPTYCDIGAADVNVVSAVEQAPDRAERHPCATAKIISTKEF
jgi:hypothetical protein